MRTFGSIVTALILLVGLTGCGDKKQVAADQTLQTAMRSFDQAPQELKSKYEALNAALEANDLAKAMASLNALTQAELSPEQQQAMVEKRQELMGKLVAAAQNGDAAAGKMIQELRTRSRSR